MYACGMGLIFRSLEKPFISILNEVYHCIKKIKKKKMDIDVVIFRALFAL